METADGSRPSLRVWILHLGFFGLFFHLLRSKILPPCLILFVFLPRMAWTQTYTITVIPKLPDRADLDSALGINDNGDVVGVADSWPTYLSIGQLFEGGISHHGLNIFPFATLFKTEQLFDLRPYFPDRFAAATGINIAGQIVGLHLPSSFLKAHAFLLSNNQLTDLGCFPTNDPLNPTIQNRCNSYAKAINSQGQIVGRATFFAPDPNNPSEQAFLYHNGNWTNLGMIGGFRISTATAINDLGDVVGYYGHTETARGTIGDPRAFLYRDGQIIDISTKIGAISEARGINNVGQVVGSYLTGNGETHAFLYDTNNDRMTDLGVLPPWRWPGTSLYPFSGSVATGINDAGEIVGNSIAGNGFLEPADGYIPGAFLYRNGRLYNLNDLRAPGTVYIVRASPVKVSPHWL